jgi:sortase A
MRRFVRILGTLMIVGGVLTLGWAVLVWQWQDPFSGLYTHLQQNRLASAYDERAQAYDAHRITGRDLAAVRRELAVEARHYRRSLHTGDAIGRLKIGRIGLSMIVVQGTDHDTLKKGPGHYPTTGLPGEGRLIYIAGHRTTYLAPFSHIDSIRPDDYVSFELPYATFTYRIVRHYVVASSDTRVLVNHGAEMLRLQACHPRFFASHRYIVDAKLVAVEPRGGEKFTVPARLAAAATAPGS